MRRLFRTFEASGVRYLLISGQASILYGAATFSEDIDLWVEPAADNFRRLMSALASCRARIHKLTPKPEPRIVRKGHGFHFIVSGGREETYLDVMGYPPRVGPFSKALKDATWWPTQWGRLPVVSIEHLVELKKTRRLQDYDVITNLVSIRMAMSPVPARALLRWAVSNSFRAEERFHWMRQAGRLGTLREARASALRDIGRLQAADTAYWRERVKDLRRLRRAGRILPEGAPVRELLSSR